MSPMNEALNGIFEFYSYLISFIFDYMALFDGVTFGWIIISCLVFGFLIRSILVLPRSLNVTDSTFSEDRYGQHGVTHRRTLGGIRSDSWKAGDWRDND